MELITCQHEWIDVCIARYRCEPPEGYRFEDAHYPLSRRLGGTETIKLWYPDHIVHGALQTLDLEYPCMYTGRRDIERPIVELIYPEYLSLYDQAYSFCQSYSGRNRGLAAHSEKNENGKSIRAVEFGRRMAKRNHARKDSKGRSLTAMKANQCHNEKDERGKSIHASKAASRMNQMLYEDPDHPELGQRNPGNLAQLQKKRGYPHGPENRKRVY